MQECFISRKTGQNGKKLTSMDFKNFLSIQSVDNIPDELKNQVIDEHNGLSCFLNGNVLILNKESENYNFNLYEDVDRTSLYKEIEVPKANEKIFINSPIQYNGTSYEDCYYYNNYYFNTFLTLNKRYYFSLTPEQFSSRLVKAETIGQKNVKDESGTLLFEYSGRKWQKAKDGKAFFFLVKSTGEYNIPVLISTSGYDNVLIHNSYYGELDVSRNKQYYQTTQGCNFVDFIYKGQHYYVGETDSSNLQDSIPIGNEYYLDWARDYYVKYGNNSNLFYLCSTNILFNLIDNIDLLTLLS